MSSSSLPPVEPLRAAAMLSSKKPIIAIDVDDVLAANAAAFVAFSNERWGTNLTVDDYHDDWALLWQLDKAHEQSLQTINERSGLYFEHSLRTMEHDVSAHEVLVELKKDFDLIVVTARRLSTKGDTLAWIQERYEGIFSEDKIFFAGFYDDMTNDSFKKDKGALLKSLGASYHIDDQPKHCNGAVAQGLTGLLFGDYRWQRAEPVDKAVVRVKNWKEILEYFNAERQRISS